MKNFDAPNSFVKKVSGRYFTGEFVGRRLARVAAEAYKKNAEKGKIVTLIDPFGGDGRLVEWFLSSWAEIGCLSIKWDVHIWDLSDAGFELARERLRRIKNAGIEVDVSFKVVDAFEEVLINESRFDVILTNPPWEMLKPDQRELRQLPAMHRDSYVESMRDYDRWISDNYSISQPKRKFAGWGTNLSRVGLEACLRLAGPQSVIGAVLPSSFFADDQSSSLREHFLKKVQVLDIAYYPAEAKLYENADISSVTVVGKRTGEPGRKSKFSRFNSMGSAEKFYITLDLEYLRKVDFIVPVSFGGKSQEILKKLEMNFKKWRDLEGSEMRALWAGREIDETGSSKWLKSENIDRPFFIKGRMIQRYKVVEEPTHRVDRHGWIAPISTEYVRIAWRDVSRPSQKRRMIATEIPAGWVAGNSLGVAYFRDGDLTRLRALLAVMNSTIFEFQLRSYLSTGHVSLSALRRVAVPDLSDSKDLVKVVDLVGAALNHDSVAEKTLDAYIARELYKLDRDEYLSILKMFERFDDSEVFALVEAYENEIE